MSCAERLPIFADAIRPVMKVHLATCQNLSPMPPALGTPYLVEWAFVVSLPFMYLDHAIDRNAA